MLKYRLVFGPLMIVFLVLVFLADEALDQISLRGTLLESLFGRSYLPAGLLLLVVMLGLIAFTARELVAIFRAEQVQADTVMIALAGFIGCTLIYIIPRNLDSQRTIAVVTSLIVLTFLVSLVRHSWRGRTEGAVTVAAVTMFALIYLGLLPGFYLAIRREHSAWVVAALILIVKCCDIGAYFTGRLIGRHKLIPWLSPGKTWEGLIGGILFSGVVALLLAALSNQAGVSGVYLKGEHVRQFQEAPYDLAFAAAAGMLLGALGQFGDLVASLFKRDAGIKDSGNAIPGFGGFLDVLDSPIVTAPFAYWLLAIAGRGAMWSEG